MHNRTLHGVDAVTISQTRQKVEFNFSTYDHIAILPTNRYIQQVQMHLLQGIPKVGCSSFRRRYCPS